MGECMENRYEVFAVSFCVMCTLILTIISTQVLPYTFCRFICWLGGCEGC